MSGASEGRLYEALGHLDGRQWAVEVVDDSIGELLALREEAVGLRAALKEIAATLGSGPCAANTCAGCRHEMESAGDVAHAALAGEYPIPSPVPEAATPGPEEVTS